MPQQEKTPTLLDYWANTTRYTIEEAKQIVKAHLKALPGFNPTSISTKYGLLLIGHGGIGKSSAIEQAAYEAGAEFWTTQVGANVYEDSHGLQKIETNGDGKPMTVHAAAAHMKALFRQPQDLNKLGIGCALWDEVSSGDKMHQNDVRAMLDGFMDENKVHAGWVKCACTNPPLPEYGTVNDLDSAICARFEPICLEPTSEEKLRYWAKTMQPTVYKFLLLHHADHNDMIGYLSARLWDITADCVERMVLAGCGRALVIKSVQAKTDKVVAEAFMRYMEAGNNPDRYPIAARELVSADADVLRDMMARVGRWTQHKEGTPLIGATKWDIVQWLKDKDNQSKLADKKVANNISKFMIDVGSNGYTDLAFSMLDVIRGTNLMRDIISQVKGTKLEKKFIEVYEKHQTAVEKASGSKAAA